MLKSGEGLSLGFILLWMAGDVTNLVGGFMAGLLPTMIILALYVSSSCSRKWPTRTMLFRLQAFESAHGAKITTSVGRSDDTQKSRQLSPPALSYGFEPGERSVSVGSTSCTTL